MKKYGVVSPESPSKNTTNWLYEGLKEAQEQARVMSITSGSQVFVVEVIGSYKSEAVWREADPAPTLA